MKTKQIEPTNRNKTEAIEWFVDVAVCAKFYRIKVPEDELRDLLGRNRLPTAVKYASKKDWKSELEASWDALWCNSYHEGAEPLLPYGIEPKINAVKNWSFSILRGGRGMNLRSTDTKRRNDFIDPLRGYRTDSYVVSRPSKKKRSLGGDV